MKLKIFLQEKNGDWKLHEGSLNQLSSELSSRNISIGASASIGAWASIGEWARIGAWARIENQYGCIVMGPLGSRQSPLTAYPHKKTIWIGTGCFLGTIDDFKAAVKKTHAGNRHEAEYLAALAYIEAKFKIKP